MSMEKIKIGIVGTRRDVFPSPEDARENWKRIRPVLENIFANIPEAEACWTDDVLEEGLLWDYAQVSSLTEYLREKKADAVFIVHANFGQEEAVGALCAQLRVPVLIWGPRDGSPEPGMPFRKTDTQCGLFASTRALLRFGVPYTYLDSCWPNESCLEKGVEDFIRTVSVVKAFSNLRILQISTRPRQFLSVKINEGELLERFGIQVIPLESGEVIHCINHILTEKKEQIDEWLQVQKKTVDMDDMSEERQRNMAAIVLGILHLAGKYDCRAVASECWTIWKEHYGIAPCHAFASLTQAGLPVCCENDIHGSVSSLLAQAAGLFRTPSFLADITVRHPWNDNGELLWHCGPFPPKLAKGKAKVAEGQGVFRLQDGALTLVRMDVHQGRYMLFADQARTTEGPETTGNYVWIETEDWMEFERKLMYGPYIHHMAGIYGEYAHIFRESCRYLDLEYDCVKNSRI